MLRTFGIVSLVIALAGCATFNAYRVKAVNLLCANRDTLTALALTNNDMATVKAIEAYCGSAVIVPNSPVATPGGN